MTVRLEKALGRTRMRTCIDSRAFKEHQGLGYWIDLYAEVEVRFMTLAFCAPAKLPHLPHRGVTSLRPLFHVHFHTAACGNGRKRARECYQIS